MNFETLVDCINSQTSFDYNTVSLLFPKESKESLRTALYRFAKSGRIVSLRRGLYSLGERYRKIKPNGISVANKIYTPSYLSERWALGWYGIIPEKVVSYTSVSPRPTRRFVNDFGTYQYRKVQQQLFTGYLQQEIMGEAVFLAEPEKALLDFWYLEAGEWSTLRMESMRFNPEHILPGRLKTLGSLYKEGRMQRTIGTWMRYAQEQTDGDINL